MFFNPGSRESYLLRLLRVSMRNIIRTLAPMPNPATRNMIPAACSAFSLHSIVVPLVAFRSIGSAPKIPAPGIPRDIVLPDRPVDMFCAVLGRMCPLADWLVDRCCALFYFTFFEIFLNLCLVVVVVVRPGCKEEKGAIDRKQPLFFPYKKSKK